MGAWTPSSWMVTVEPGPGMREPESSTVPESPTPMGVRITSPGSDSEPPAGATTLGTTTRLKNGDTNVSENTRVRKELEVGTVSRNEPVAAFRHSTASSKVDRSSCAALATARGQLFGKIVPRVNRLTPVESSQLTHKEYVLDDCSHFACYPGATEQERTVDFDRSLEAISNFSAEDAARVREAECVTATLKNMQAVARRLKRPLAPAIEARLSAAAHEPQ